MNTRKAPQCSHILKCCGGCSHHLHLIQERRSTDRGPQSVVTTRQNANRKILITEVCPSHLLVWTKTVDNQGLSAVILLFILIISLSRQQLFRFSFYKLRIKQPELSFFTNWIIIHLLDVTDWAPVLGHCGLYRLINRNLSDGCEVKGRKIYFFTTTKQGDELPELHVWFTWLSLPAGPRLDNLLSPSIKLKLTRRMIDLSPHITRGHRLSDQTLTEWCHGDGQTDRRSWSVYYQLWRFSKPFKVID